MLKIELRKLSIFILSIAVVTMVVACQGSSSSSKSEPLVTPSGSGNVMGTYLFDVNPVAETVQITPVGSPVSSTPIPGDGTGVIPNIAVSTMHGRYVKPAYSLIQGIQPVSAQATAPLGTGALAYTAVGTTITWAAPGDAAGAPVNIGLSNGLVTLTSGGPSGTTLTIRVVRGCGTGDNTCLPAVNTNDATITISNANPSWNGSDTLSFDAKIAWNDPGFELNNVRLAVQQYTNGDVKLMNYSQCTGVAWSSCGGTPAAMTYVADALTDGPMTYRNCNTAGLCTTNSFHTSIAQGCGSVVGHWTLSEGTGAAYRFWAYLYGDKKPVGDLASDPRYRDDMGSIYLRPRKLTLGAYPAPGAVSNSMAPGEWFYVHYYVDASGNSRPIPYDGSLNGMKSIEDTGNMAAYQGGTNSTATYWFIDGMLMMTLRFDPALLEIMSKGTNPYDPPSNNSVNKLTTAKGTTLRAVTGSAQLGWNILNQWAALANASNRMGMIRMDTGVFSSTYPVPGNGSRGVVGASWDAGWFAMHAKTGVTGSGYIRPEYSPATAIMGRNTLGNAASPGGVGQKMERTGIDATSWPNWCWMDLIPNYLTCGATHNGFYNADRTYVCIQ